MPSTKLLLRVDEPETAAFIVRQIGERETLRYEIGINAAEHGDLVERRSFAEHVGSETVAQQMRADVLLRRLQASLPERVLQHGVYDLGILEGRMVRRPRRDEQRTRVAGSSVSDVIHDRFAHIRGKRHPIMQLALAADEDLARAPVDVVELDRDNLGSAKSEPRHEQQHRVVAPPDGVVGANRLDQPLDLFGLEIARQMVGAGGDARQAVGEIAPGLAAPEQELEQAAQMRRQRLVARGFDPALSLHRKATISSGVIAFRSPSLSPKRKTTNRSRKRVQ
jgi:hypothetical protein